MLSLGGLVAGCTAQSGSNYSQLFSYAQRSLDGQDKALTASQVAAQPGVSIAVSIGGAAQEMMVLAQTAGREKLWKSSARLVIATQAGRIIRTFGLTHDLTDLTPIHRQAILPPSAAIAAPAQQFLRADFQGDSLFAEPITCTARAAGPKQITIFGREFQTMRVNEYCNAPRLNWHFENSYWIDAKNLHVWRSIQHVAPGMAPIEIEPLHPLPR